MELAVGCVMCAAAARERGHGGDRAGASAVAMRELWEMTGAMQAWRRGIRQDDMALVYWSGAAAAGRPAGTDMSGAAEERVLLGLG